uniref:Uncharacterized protein n=1 Tax=Arundo donax TaxID=35708 RepID=A0A0A8ZVG7_ARUDO
MASSEDPGERSRRATCPGRAGRHVPMSPGLRGDEARHLRGLSQCATWLPSGTPRVH